MVAFKPTNRYYTGRKKGMDIFPVSGDHISLLHDGSCHWLLAFTSSCRFQVCNSLRTNLTSISKKCFKSLFQPLVRNGKLEVTFLPVDKQTMVSVVVSLLWAMLVFCWMVISCWYSACCEWNVQFLYEMLERRWYFKQRT